MCYGHCLEFAGEKKGVREHALINGHISCLREKKECNGSPLKVSAPDSGMLSRTDDADLIATSISFCVTPGNCRNRESCK